jgi:hypothetical protein
MKFLAPLLLFLLWPLAGRAEEPETLNMPGLLAIPAPETGFHWKAEKNSEKSLYYTCLKEGSPQIVTLKVLKSDLATDQVRRSFLEADFKNLTDLAHKSFEITIDDFQKPSMEFPIPDQVSFTFKQKLKSNGQTRYDNKLVLFGRYTYHLTFNTDKETAAKDYFEKIIKQFQSLPAAELDTLTVPGVFTVKAPEKHYYWKDLTPPENKNSKTFIFFCSKAGDRNSITIFGQQQELTLNSARLMTIRKGNVSYDRMIKIFQNRGLTVANARVSDSETVIPDRVPYSFVVKSKDKEDLYVSGVFVFGKSVYNITSAAISEKESQQLLENVLKSLDEKSQIKDTDFVEPWYFSIATPEGCKWKEIARNPRMYECVKEKSKLKIFLNLRENKLDAHEAKKSMLDRLATFRKEQFEKEKFEIDSYQSPYFPARDPDFYRYSIKAKSPKGDFQYMFCKVLFRKRIYILEVFGPEKENPNELAESLINSLHELKME